MGDADAADLDMDALWRAESRPVLATLTRLLGDLDLAEEALHEAFTAALERWPREGRPARPRAWLISTGRFKAIDALRRRSRFDASMRELHERLLARAGAGGGDADEIADDQLRLIFACCHPSLAEEAQVALTLREVCGLTTEEIARAFLVAASAMAQRIVRAKLRLREEGPAAFEPPPRAALTQRVDAVLRVVYLVFNAGWTVPALAAEALRLGRLLRELLDEPEVEGLLALMLLLEARRATRTTPEGDLVLLEDQDRSRWDRALIGEGVARLEGALRSRRFGPYALQAAIAAVHAQAPSVAATDWRQVVALYELLQRAEPSPVVALNRAIALGMRDGPAAGLAAVEALLAGGELGGYLPAHAARGDLLRRLGRGSEARSAFARALELAREEPERRFFRRRLAEQG